ncbi:hypothetical protein FQN54_004948 [Arachnomyces sp. PD_36]|nr:hypothetical protein FQN54_004948 [Arachnomyces sp. PD_36]
MKGSLVWASALLSAACVQANEWHAYYRLNADAYQAKFDEMVEDGYRLNSVSGYEYEGEANFAVIFEQRESAAWMSHSGLTFEEYDAKFQEYLDEGYHVVQVNGYTIDDVDYYAAIWDKSPVGAWASRTGMSREYMQDYFDKYLEEGYIMTHVSGYERDGQALFAAVWEQREAKHNWSSVGELNAEDFQKEFDQKLEEGYRLVDVDGYQKDGTAYFVGIWNDSEACAWESRAELDSASFQELFDKYREEGYILRSFSGYNVGDEDRYAGIWVKPSV